VFPCTVKFDVYGAIAPKNREYVQPNPPTEALLKVLALGVFWEDAGTVKTQYFRSAWNWLDFLIVVLGWLQLGLNNFGSSTPFTSAIRLVRLLRPLTQQTVVPAFRYVMLI
jgi:hypothetical protein